MSKERAIGITSRIFNAASGLFFASTATIATFETAAIAARRFPVPFIEHLPIAIGLGLLTAFAAAASVEYSLKNIKNAFVPRP